MIQKVHAKNFKAQTFSDDLSSHNLFTGKNGSGKSARTDALMLALNGFLINGPRRNADIIDGYSDADQVFVGVEIGNRSFARRIKKSGDGTAKQTYYIDKAVASKSNFIEKLADAGSPTVINVAKFMSLSDQMKISTIFALFPPSRDVAELDIKLQKAKDELNGMLADIRESNKLIETLTLNKQADKPVGNAAQVSEQIKMVEGEIAEITQAIQSQQVAEAARKVQEEVDRKQAEAEKLRLEAAAKRKKLAEIRAKKKAELPCDAVKLCIIDGVCKDGCFVKQHCMNQKCFKEA